VVHDAGDLIDFVVIAEKLTFVIGLAVWYAEEFVAAVEQKQPAVLLPAVVASASTVSPVVVVVVVVVALMSELLVEVGVAVVQFGEMQVNVAAESAGRTFEESELIPEVIKPSAAVPGPSGRFARPVKQFSLQLVRFAVAGKSFVVLSQAASEASAQSSVSVKAQMH
jgi:hypothetical protein